MSFLDESWAAKDLSKPDGGTGGIQLAMAHNLDAVSYIDYPIIYLCCWFTCSLGRYYYLIVIDEYTMNVLQCTCIIVFTQYANIVLH